MRYSRIIAKIAIAVVLVTSAEVSVRLIERVRYGVPIWATYYENGSLFAINTLGKKGRPNAQFKECHLNSLGLRGSELQRDSRRILFIGSSEVFGFCDTLDPDLPQQLQYQLNWVYGNGQYDVLNLSYPEARLSELTEYLPGIAERTKPFLAFVYPAPATYIYLQVTNVSAVASPNPTSYLRITPYLKWCFRNLVPIRIRALMYSQLIQHLTTGGATAVNVPSENVLHYLADLETLVRQLQSRGVKPVLMTHATPFAAPLTLDDRAMLVNWRRYYPLLTESGFLDMELRFNDATRAYAASHGLMLVDVDLELRGCRECFVDFTHFSVRGSRQVANLLVTTMERDQVITTRK